MNPRQQVDVYLKLLDHRDSGASIPEEIFVFAEDNFVMNAQTYLKSIDTRYGYQAFAEMGVSEEVLERAGVKDQSLKSLEKDFIAYAKPYLDSQGLTYADLIHVGVPADVLFRAGLRPKTSALFEDLPSTD